MLAVAALSIATAVAAQAADAGPWYVACGPRPGATDLHALHADGRLERLTNGAQLNGIAARVGQAVVATLGTNGQTRIVRVVPQPSRLLASHAAGSPRLSMDGRRVAWTALSERRGRFVQDVWVKRLDRPEAARRVARIAGVLVATDFDARGVLHVAVRRPGATAVLAVSPKGPTVRLPRIDALRFGPAGLVATAQGRQITVRDGLRGAVVRTRRGAFVQGWDAAGTLLVSDTAGRLEAWDPRARTSRDLGRLACGQPYGGER
ncbi:hypothetical protein [Conexibacter sp. SYSU D00693]|uniref:hypothetical protein n=1 Tax=Conexibacter sp. SYSU D00693 TaxID=2812560 RepID=UPI00196B7838|nr:hypothetical protein [Conexibacter sp. SYSU D00693]